MNLYKVLLTHAAPKDNVTAIKEYVIAKDEKQLFNYLKGKNSYTYWYDYEEDKDEYDDMLRIDYIFEHKGDIDCDDKWEDLYYGSTMYSWELHKEDISEEEGNILSNLGVAVWL